MVVGELHEMHSFSDLWVETKMKSDGARKLHNDHILDFGIRGSSVCGLAKLSRHAD